MGWIHCSKCNRYYPDSSAACPTCGSPQRVPPPRITSLHSGAYGGKGPPPPPPTQHGVPIMSKGQPSGLPAQRGAPIMSKGLPSGLPIQQGVPIKSKGQPSGLPVQQRVPIQWKVPPPPPTGQQGVLVKPKVWPPVPPPVKVITAPSQNFDLTLYRGEFASRWPYPPQKRLIWGMNLKNSGRWRCKTMEELFATLQNEIKDHGGVSAYGQFLRAEGRAFALATARTDDGAYEGDYKYTLLITGVRTFYWGPNLSKGKPALFKELGNIDDDYIVLNAEEIHDSTILAFGHKTGTAEVTFFHDLPLKCVVSCKFQRGNKVIPIGQLGIMTPDKLTMEERGRELRELVRFGKEGPLRI